MPYPKPDDPDYCPGSETAVPDYEDNKHLEWHRCPSCGRLIAAKPRGIFFPHVNNRKRARRGDAIQEGLTAYGHNRKQPRTEPVYSDPEPVNTD